MWGVVIISLLMSLYLNSALLRGSLVFENYINKIGYCVAGVASEDFAQRPDNNVFIEPTDNEFLDVVLTLVEFRGEELEFFDFA